MALVWACEHFHFYLFGIMFELSTDHKLIEVIYSNKLQPSARIWRWLLRLQPYSFVVRHIPGKNGCRHIVASFKDQRGLVNDRNVAEEYVRYVADHAAPKAIPVTEMDHESMTDPELCTLRDLFNMDIGTIVQKSRRRVMHLAHEGHQGIEKSKVGPRDKGVSCAMVSACEQTRCT